MPTPRKLSVRTRVFLGVAACAVILVIWQALAPQPPRPTDPETAGPQGALAPTDDEAWPDGLPPAQAPKPTPDEDQPEQWVQFGDYEFSRQAVVMAAALLAQLIVAAVVLTFIVIRRRTICCPACRRSFPRSAPICPHCSADPRAN